MQLYKIASEYEQIIDELYDEEGNMNPQALIRLEANEAALESKAIAIASWIKNMSAEKDAIEQAKKNMLDREKALKNKIDSWKDYIKQNMERRGIQEIKCPHFVLKIKKNPEAVDDYDADNIPEEYKKYTVSLDRVLIKDHIHNGVVIPGARLKQDTSLSIK